MNGWMMTKLTWGEPACVNRFLSGKDAGRVLGVLRREFGAQATNKLLITDRISFYGIKIGGQQLIVGVTRFSGMTVTLSEGRDEELLRRIYEVLSRNEV
ncbi:MAG: hypothetical protein IJ806_00690 [Ruminococcus sp.]|nr:hypothetical protein [Ruminococcus sp.]